MKNDDDNTLHDRECCVSCYPEYSFLYGQRKDADRGDTGMAPQSCDKAESFWSIIPVLSADRSCCGQYPHQRSPYVRSTQQHHKNDPASQHDRIYGHICYYHDRNCQFACSLCLNRYEICSPMISEEQYADDQNKPPAQRQLQSTIFRRINNEYK